MHGAYLDNNATTPLDPRVLAAMHEFQRTVFGNPSSVHAYGRLARRHVEDARRKVAALVGSSEREVVFTSSGTEANNHAVFGLLERAPKDRRAVVAAPIEHPSVLAALDRAARSGVEIRWMPVRSDGRVDIERSRDLVRDDVAFAALMLVNNETGVVQPVEEWSTICAAHGVPLHVDAVQAAGKMSVRFATLGAATLALSAHKIHGPKGVGALVVKGGVRLAPFLVGGGQERDRRAGTENMVGIVGFGVAAELAEAEGEDRRRKTAALSARLLEGVASVWPEAVLHGSEAERVPGTLNLRFSGFLGETLLMNFDLRGVAVSLGSACSSGSIEPSHVLEAMGLTIEENLSSIRVSIASTNDDGDVARFVAALAEIRAQKIRAT